MFKNRKQLLLAVAVAGAGVMAMSNYARSADVMPCGPQMQQPPSDEQRAKFAERMHEREMKLHDDLKLTSAQEGAWKTFIDQMKPPVMAAGGMHRPSKEEMDKETAPERMQQRLDMMKKMEAHMEQESAALKKFYAVLTPDQKKVMDEHFNHAPRDRFERKDGPHGRDNSGMPPPKN
ncbi:MAG: Spy/CpxP family protein refolding chaperone [Sulfuriferula sp.]|nr:Spy/CpxP family protein refolding chaperone [Sulfuriferula sp.]